MPEFSLPTTLKPTPDDMARAITEISKTLQWLLNNLDSMNITDLDSNVTSIKSTNGETAWEGTVFRFGDGTRNRFNLGYDGANFLFDLYNKTGGLVLATNTNGDIIFGSKIAFFNAAPTTKTTVSDLPPATAGTTYSPTEQTMLQSVYNKMNELLNALQSYNLV